MTQSDPRVPFRLVEQTRDALAHCYDHVYLSRHSLLPQVASLVGDDPTTAPQRLRQLLLEAVERLRPYEGTPPDSPAWRPYVILHRRCVQGTGFDELAQELGLSKRQILREQSKGCELVARELWTRVSALAEEQAPAPVAHMLAEEISRAAAGGQTFDAVAQLQSALEPARALACRRQIDLDEQWPAMPMLALGDPSLLKQLLVSAVSFCLRMEAVDRVGVRIEREGMSIVCSVIASGTAPSPALSSEELPNALLLLAQAGQAHLTQDSLDGDWRLRIAVPAAEGEHVVAIVEDNKDLVKLFSRFLAGHGCRLVEIADPADALARVVEIGPRALVLDLMMSQVDGWQVLQSLKADPRVRHIPVVVCSVLDEEEMALSLGASAYLRKPVRPAQLLECLVSLACP